MRRIGLRKYDCYLQVVVVVDDDDDVFGTFGVDGSVGDDGLDR